MITFILTLLLVVPMLLVIGISEQEQQYLIDSYNYINSRYEREFMIQSSYINNVGDLVIKFETEGTEGIDEWVEVIRHVHEDGSITYSDNYDVQLMCDSIRNGFMSNQNILDMQPIIYVHRPSIVLNGNKSISSHVEISLLLNESILSKYNNFSELELILTNYLNLNFQSATTHVYIISEDVYTLAMRKGMLYFYRYTEKHGIEPKSITIRE